MSNTNDTPNISHGTLDDHRPLADSELDVVSGGGFGVVVAQMAAAAAKAADPYPDWSNRPPCGIMGPLSPWGDPIHPC